MNARISVSHRNGAQWICVLLVHQWVNVLEVSAEISTDLHEISLLMECDKQTVRRIIRVFSTALSPGSLLKPVFEWQNSRRSDGDPHKTMFALYQPNESECTEVAMVAPLTRHRYMLMGSSLSRPPDGNFRGSEKSFDKWAIHWGLAVCLGW